MGSRSNLKLGVLSIALLFVIAGCGRGDGDIISKDRPFLGGTNGLQIKFLKDAPPREVFDGDNFRFQAIVSVVNEGEFDVFATDLSDINLNLVGFFVSDFKSDKASTDPDLDFNDAQLTGRSPDDKPTARIKDSEGNIIDAVETIVTFPDDGKFFQYKNTLVGNTDFIFRANACYKYQTKGVSQICVLENMIDVDKDAVCNPKDSKQIFSSASPVQVTGFKQTVVGEDKLQFSFDVVHSGTGNVFTSTATTCPQDAAGKRTNENKVKVTVKTGLTGVDSAGNNIKLKCANANPTTTGIVSVNDIRLVNGRRTITCTQELGVDRDFEQSADISVDFYYFDSVDTNVLVKKTG
jgi:hypothetical protein